MSDALERAKRGDRAAVEQLLTELAPRVYRFGLRLCGNPHDADDVLQDTLVNVTQHLGEFEGRSSLSSWVFALARSACARRRRGLKNAAPCAEDAAPELSHAGPTPEAQAAGNELLAAFSRALDALPPESREALLLRDVEGLSAADAADALGVSVDALKSRLHRARAALREALRPLLEPDSAPAPAGCPDIMALWSRRLEGELSQNDCARMEAHLRGCASCGAACDALKRALVVCQNVATTEVPPEVQARVKAAVEAVSATRPSSAR
jgi:RNA polymerase sigma-70 factor, ECF subfamily